MGVPPFFSPKLFVLPKVAKLANLKCQKGSRIIRTPEDGATSDSAREGQNLSFKFYFQEKCFCSFEKVDKMSNFGYR